MKQEVFELKSELKGRISHGDLAKAARAVGVNRVAFYNWFYAETIWPSVDARNLKALQKVVLEREKEFHAQMAA